MSQNVLNKSDSQLTDDNSPLQDDNALNDSFNVLDDDDDDGEWLKQAAGSTKRPASAARPTTGAPIKPGSAGFEKKANGSRVASAQGQKQVEEQQPSTAPTPSQSDNSQKQTSEQTTAQSAVTANESATADLIKKDLDNSFANDIQQVMNIHHFELLMQTFKDAEENEGSSGFNIDQFYHVFGRVLGNNLTHEQMTLLFMKIDANSDGTIDWDEFSTYMMSGSMVASERTFIFNEKDKGSVAGAHHDMIRTIDFIPKERKYVTVSREGTVCLWTPEFVLQKSINTKDFMPSQAWITDSCFMHEYNKLAVLTDDRQMCVYDVLSIKPRCILAISPLEHNPSCICFARPNDDEVDMLLFGDDGGYLNILSFSRRFFVDNSGDGDPLSFTPAALNRKDVSKNGIIMSRRKVHDEWMLNIRFYPEMNSFVSCSSERTRTLVIGDIERKSVRQVHVQKGIRCFDYCRRPSFLVTGGRDKTLRLWNPYVLSKCAGTLTGHNATITNIIINHMDSHIISLSEDKCIKIWDTRNLSCLQTIVDKTYTRPENLITALFWDTKNRVLLSGTNTLDSWPVHQVNRSNKAVRSHDAPLVAALFNHSFHQIVSGCHDSTVTNWSLASGEKTFQFHNVHRDQAISAMCFDHSGRRLITGSRDSFVKIWNFNNGQILQKLQKDNDAEITDICYAESGHNKYVLCAGWDKKISVFRDDPSRAEAPVLRTISLSETNKDHEDDFLTLAFLAPNTLATGSLDGKIHIWNFNSGHVKSTMKDSINEIKDHEERAVEKVLFLQHVERDYQLMNERNVILASCHADSYIRFWNIHASELLHEYCCESSLPNGLTTMSFNANAGVLLVGDIKGYVYLFDVTAMRLMPNVHDYSPFCILKSKWRAHVEQISSVVFVHGLGTVVTSSKDMTVRLWTMTGEHIGVFGQEVPWTINDKSSFMPLPSEVKAENDREAQRLAAEAAAALEEKERNGPAGGSKKIIGLWKKTTSGPFYRDPETSSESSTPNLSPKKDKTSTSKKWKELYTMTTSNENWTMTSDLLTMKRSKNFFSFDGSRSRLTKKKPVISKQESAYHNLPYHAIEEVSLPPRPVTTLAASGNGPNAALQGLLMDLK